MFCWLLSAAAGSDLGLGLSPLFRPSFDPSLEPDQAGSSAILRGGGHPLILVGPTLATNFLSTSLIVLQAWCVWHASLRSSVSVLKERGATSRRRKRRTLINHLGRYGIAIQAEKIFALLIESGFAYCCFWVRPLALFMSVPHVLTLDALRGRAFSFSQILYLISAFRVFPTPGFAVMDAVLPYVSVRIPLFSLFLPYFPADLSFDIHVVRRASTRP